MCDNGAAYNQCVELRVRREVLLLYFVLDEIKMLLLKSLQHQVLSHLLVELHELLPGFVLRLSVRLLSVQTCSLFELTIYVFDHLIVILADWKYVR